VMIEAKFTEITQSDSKALGFDWFLGNTTMRGGKIGAQAGTAPSYTGAPSEANPLGTFPGVPPGVDLANPFGTTYPASPTDQLLTGGLRNSAAAPAVGTITGILTDPQFRVVIRALEQRDGVDLLSAPRVTTLSGRQAKIEVQQLRSIVVGQNFNATAGGGGQAGALGGAAATAGVVSQATQYDVAVQPFGQALDVIPYVSADNHSVQMTIIPTITEFLGYDEETARVFVPVAQSGAGNTLGTPLAARLPLPIYRVRQVVTSAIVWDGQTIVLGGLLAEDIQKSRDKVPVLGDLPLLGRFFRSESQTTSKRNLVIFVTPTIIDPAGNRVHMEDNLPFDPSWLPTAPTSAAAPVLP
jgi:general secretion pathway protein D